MLFSHKFVGPLLTPASKLTIGELVAIEGEGGREASDVDFIGSKACGGANERRILVFVADHD